MPAEATEVRRAVLNNALNYVCTNGRRWYLCHYSLAVTLDIDWLASPPSAVTTISAQTLCASDVKLSSKISFRLHGVLNHTDARKSASILCNKARSWGIRECKNASHGAFGTHTLQRVESTKSGNTLHLLLQDVIAFLYLLRLCQECIYASVGVMEGFVEPIAAESTKHHVCGHHGKLY
jgi:hypothetical protein